MGTRSQRDIAGMGVGAEKASQRRAKKSRLAAEATPPIAHTRILWAQIDTYSHTTMCEVPYAV